MKTIFKLLAAASLTALLGSCVGQKEEAKPNVFVKLTNDRAQVDIDKGEAMTFTVTADGIDVTQKATIINTTDGGYEVLKEEGKNLYTFEPRRPVNHRFIALFEDNSSETLEIRAFHSADQSDTFYRRSCMMKFTGTWCAYCPEMGERIKDVAKKRPDRLIEIAVHNSDNLTIPIGEQLARYASATLLPEVMVDYRAATRVSFRTELALTNEMDKSIADNPTVAGVKLAVAKNGSNLQIDTETKVSRKGQYNLVVAVLVDGYAYEQTGARDPNYRQNSVLRAYVTKGDDVINGERLGVEAADYMMVPQETSAKSYTYAVEGVSDMSRVRVVALVLNKIATEYRINNITQCNVGQTVDYQYEDKPAE